TDAGSALMGIGEASGEGRAEGAAKAAITSPLLEVSIDGATGILFNIIGGSDLTMHEVDEAARLISQSADSNANIIFGATIDESMKDQMKITVIATGFSMGASESIGSGEKKQMGEERGEDGNAFEAPAFLRRQRK
ncbi:cell division protein FtsZ, partial [Candidatus Saccharibacteria bacterium]|nr:cell division protein FtsZ [Candidatus Saccharibacteria bacterium]